MHFQKFAEFPRPPARVLEVGCGNGLPSQLLATAGYEVIGIDISKVAVGWARTEFQRLGLKGYFSMGDVCCIDLPEKYIDLVVDGNCFHYVCGSERRTAVEEVRRVLRPGGFFLLSSMCGPPKAEEKLRSYDPRTHILSGNGKMPRYIPPVECLLLELAEGGFIPRRQLLNRHPWWDHLWVLAEKVGTDATST